MSESREHDERRDNEETDPYYAVDDETREPWTRSAVAAIEQIWDRASPKWHRLLAELQRRYPGDPEDEPSIGDVHGHGSG